MSTEPPAALPNAQRATLGVLSDRLLLAAIACAALLLGALSVARYTGYNAGMLDLGNMAQAIASVRRGEPLVFTYVDGPTSRLAFHVELFYFLLAPFYALWPDPRLLVGLQALLFALGALPVYRLAARATASRFAARCLALIYLLYPTAQTSVLFDLHGDTLALPLLLFALDALDRRAWRSYALWVALALSCKFYVALPVALVGVLLLWRGQRRVGLATLVIALGYGALAFFVIRPLFTTAQTSSAHRGLSYLSFYFGQLGELSATLGDRLLSALVVFGPALLLAWRGRRWLLPGLPIAAAALLSTGPGGAYDFRYHHYATVVPFIIMAAIEGVRTMRQSREPPYGRIAYAPETQNPKPALSLPNGSKIPNRRSWRGDTALTLAIVALFSLLLVDTPLNPLFWLRIPGQGLDHAVYGITARDGVKDRFLAEAVPPVVPLAASTFLATHLVDRPTLYLVRYPDDPGGQRLPRILPQVNYLLADALFDWRVPSGDGFAGGLTYERTEIALLLRDPAFGLIAQRDGLLLFRRGAAGTQALAQQALAEADSGQLATQRFGDGPELLEHRIELLPTQPGDQPGARRLRASFTWRAGSARDVGPLVAVSRLEGLPNTRIVHLPSYVLLPVERWQPGQRITERFELQLPSRTPPGRYTWHTAWYAANAPEAASTDARSRIGDEASIETIHLP